MSTIDNNELFSVLRDLYNHSIEIMDAMEKVQGLTKAEMKEVVTEDIPPEELAAQVEEAQSDTPSKAEDVVTNTKKTRK